MSRLPGLLLTTVIVCLVGCGTSKVNVSLLKESLTHHPVETLTDPSLEKHLAQVDTSEGYRFVMFGDQKGLWQEDFGDLLSAIAATAKDTSKLPLLFMVDSGDIVVDGGEASQFQELARHLHKVRDLPYLVGVGNHETRPEKTYSDTARKNTATFLGLPNPDSLYYSKTIGPARFLFLNTNELPGVYPELYDNDPSARDRAEAQLKWLAGELGKEVHPTIVVSHHALFQSARRHRDQADSLWIREHGDLGNKTLPEALIDGGVDLVLTGHVHSYEIFELERDHRRMWSLNASGLPQQKGIKGWFQRKCAGSRMPENWQTEDGKDKMEQAFGVKAMDREDPSERVDEERGIWRARQVTRMSKTTKVNQYAEITVSKTGKLDIKLISVSGDTLFSLQIPPP